MYENVTIKHEESLFFKNYSELFLLFVKVISYPFLDGNIPKNLSYGVFSSQLIRMANINTTLKGFKECIFSLVKKLVGQGFDVAALRNKFVKFYKYKINIWGKFGVDIYSHFIEMFNNL